MIFTDAESQNENLAMQKIQNVILEIGNAFDGMNPQVHDLRSAENYLVLLNIRAIHDICRQGTGIPRMCEIMREHIALARNQNDGNINAEGRCGYIRDQDWDEACRALLTIGGLAFQSYDVGNLDDCTWHCTNFASHFSRFLAKCRNDMNLFVNRQLFIVLWSFQSVYNRDQNFYEGDLDSILLDIPDAMDVLEHVAHCGRVASDAGTPPLCTLGQGSPDFTRTFGQLTELGLESQSGAHKNWQQFLAEIRQAAQRVAVPRGELTRLFNAEIRQVRDALYHLTQGYAFVTMEMGNQNAQHQDRALPTVAGIFHSEMVPPYHGQIRPHRHMMYNFSILRPGVTLQNLGQVPLRFGIFSGDTTRDTPWRA